MNQLPSPDLLGLAMAPMRERVAALRAEWSRVEEPGPLPSRAVQVAGLVVGETVRLIRLGEPAEVTGAARELSKLVARHTPDAATLHPESYRLAAGASVVLGAAGSPSSAGAEFAVLRSWNGKAKRTVELLNRAHGKALARSELRAEFDDLTESALTHLLADLESAGLALRIKEGRTVTVHLGPIARRDHVQERLETDHRPLPVAVRGTERDLDPSLRRQIDGIYKGIQVPLEPRANLKILSGRDHEHYVQAHQFFCDVEPDQKRGRGELGAIGVLGLVDSRVGEEGNEAEAISDLELAG